MNTNASRSYVMHTTDNCPWCYRAKALFKYYRAEVVELREPCSQWPTYPAIYEVVGEARRLIGGYDELFKHSLQNGL
jgi:hypothetical protein